MARITVQNEYCTLSNLCFVVVPVTFGMHLLYVALDKSVCFKHK
uniref:Uncharacterized protein n=1 Tax=Anguilla anguilla TaxID=7936 RepID=A0A0E9Q9J3_ANGAN